MQNIKANNIDEYIFEFPKEIQEKLQRIRSVIRKTVPDAEEKISYAIPTFTLNNTNLVHFAAFKNHIGFYPTPVAGEQFKEELSSYKTGKGSVQFPYKEKIPYDLIIRIVEFRVREVLAKNKKDKV